MKNTDMPTLGSQPPARKTHCTVNINLFTQTTVLTVTTALTALTIHCIQVMTQRVIQAMTTTVGFTATTTTTLVLILDTTTIMPTSESLNDTRKFLRSILIKN